MLPPTVARFDTEDVLLRHHTCVLTHDDCFRSLQQKKPVTAETFESVTVYFSDIHDFHTLTAESTPLEVSPVNVFLLKWPDVFFATGGQFVELAVPHVWRTHRPLWCLQGRDHQRLLHGKECIRGSVCLWYHQSSFFVWSIQLKIASASDRLHLDCHQERWLLTIFPVFFTFRRKCLTSSLDVKLNDNLCKDWWEHGTGIDCS